MDDRWAEAKTSPSGGRLQYMLLISSRTWAKLKTHILIITDHPRHELSLNCTDFFIYIYFFIVATAEGGEGGIWSFSLVIRHVRVVNPCLFLSTRTVPKRTSSKCARAKKCTLQTANTTQTNWTFVRPDWNKVHLAATSLNLEKWADTLECVVLSANQLTTAVRAKAAGHSNVTLYVSGWWQQLCHYYSTAASCVRLN